MPITLEYKIFDTLSFEQGDIFLCWKIKGECILNYIERWIMVKQENNRNIGIE